MGPGQPHAQLLRLPDPHAGHGALHPLPGGGPGRPVAPLRPGEPGQTGQERPVLATSQTLTVEAEHGASVPPGRLEVMRPIEICHLLPGSDVPPSHHDGLVSLKMRWMT